MNDNPTPREEAFKLAHLSDPHLFLPKEVSVRDLLNKRVYGYLSWQLRRRAEHRGEILSALLEDLHAADPDHIVLTGDLTHLGLPSEFRKALGLLTSLGPPSKVMAMPGNHDAYVTTDWNDTFRLWLAYLASDAVSGRAGDGKDPRTLFPTLRVRGGTALIGICTAHPTAPFLATGTIGEIQLKKLEEILVEMKRRGLVRILMLHHPPVPGAVSWRNRLTDQPALEALVARHGAELILHGHTHRAFRGSLTTPWGPVVSIGVPSASAIGRTEQRRARYHLFRITQKSGVTKILLTVRVYSPEIRRFTDEEEQPIPLPQRNS